MRVGIAIALSLLVSGTTVRLPAVARGAPAPRQPDRDPIERSTLRLHYGGKAIGDELYSISPDGDGVALSSDFDFTDRGGRVQLRATVRTKRDYTPVAFKATGRSYRFVNVDSDIRIDGGDAVVRADGAETRV